MRCDYKGPFKRILIKVISVEVIPDINSLDQADVTIVGDAIKSCCHVASQGLNWVNGECSELEEFCLHFTLSCCSAIKATCDSLQWIPKHGLIQSLTKLYRVLVNQQKVQSLPSSISNTGYNNQYCLK